MKLAELPPLSLYVHLPWCIRKCPYCDFNSHERRGDLPEAEYVDALVADLEASLPGVWGRPLHTIFLGGGTPSLFAPDAIERLITAIGTLMKVDPGTEITMEANPGTFEAGRFRGFREAGVNRLSIGVQSFDDAKLAAIGRVHGSREARAALDTALEIYPTVNADLMYALPGQAHRGSGGVTCRRPSQPARLTSPPTTSPSSPTRTSRASRRSFPARTNRPTCRKRSRPRWRRQASSTTRPRPSQAPASARSTTSTTGPSAITWDWARGRTARSRFATASRARSARESRSLTCARRWRARRTQRLAIVAEEELPFEFMLNALRLIEGFPISLFAERTGIAIMSIEPQLRDAEAAGLIERDHATTIGPTRRGERFLNDLLEMFLPSARARGAPYDPDQYFFAGYVPSFMNGGSRPTRASSITSSASVWFMKGPGAMRIAPPSSVSSNGSSWCVVFTVRPEAMPGPSITASP